MDLYYRYKLENLIDSKTGKHIVIKIPFWQKTNLPVMEKKGYIWNFKGRKIDSTGEELRATTMLEF